MWAYEASEVVQGEKLYMLCFSAGPDTDLYLYAVTHAQTAVFNMTIASKVSSSAKAFMKHTAGSSASSARVEHPVLC